MSQFARFLIGAGVTSNRYAAIARLGYYLAASERARFGNDRLNQSAVAAMTGLTRVQVRQFAKQQRPRPNPARDRIDTVLEGWTTDPAYLDTDSTPKLLRPAGTGACFASLARTYGGDLPAKALLRELQRHGLVSVTRGFVALNKSAAATRTAEYRLRVMSLIMADLIRSETRVTTPDSRMRAIQLEVLYPTAGSKGRILLEKRAGDGMRTFLAGLQTSAAALAVSSPPPKRRKNSKSRARLVLITEEIGKTQD